MRRISRGMYMIEGSIHADLEELGPCPWIHRKLSIQHKQRRRDIPDCSSVHLQQT